MIFMNEYEKNIQSELINRLYEFLQNNKNDLNVEIKPDEYSNIEDNNLIDNEYKQDLEIIKKDYATK